MPRALVAAENSGDWPSVSCWHYCRSAGHARKANFGEPTYRGCTRTDGFAHQGPEVTR